MKIELRLFASLRSHLPPGGDGRKTVWELPPGSRVQDLIDQLGIPAQLAQLVMVDGRQQSDKDFALHEGAVVSIFPPVAGGSRRAEQVRAVRRIFPQLRGEPPGARNRGAESVPTGS
jgi:molybdopterin converting factor small subunit